MELSLNITSLCCLVFYFVTIVGSSTEPPYLLHHHKLKDSFIAWPALHTIKLKCKANGSAPLHFQWLKDGKPIINRRLQPLLKTNQWFLRIRELLPSDTGDYTCIVSNPYGKVNHTYNLYVVAKARSRPILKCGYPKNKTAEMYSNVKLKCIVALSGTQPDFRWIRWHKIPSNYEKSLKFNYLDEKFAFIDPIHYSTMRNLGNKGHYGVELLLKNLTEKDFGLYTCVVSNHMGQDYRSAFLMRKEPESIPVKAKLEVTLLNQQRTTKGPLEGTQTDVNNNAAKNPEPPNYSTDAYVPVSTFIGTIAGVVLLLVGFILWFHYQHKKKQTSSNATLL